MGSGYPSPLNHFAYVGEEAGTEHDEKIKTFRERFEIIIKTDGEDLGSGPGRSRQTPSTQPTAPPSAHLASGNTGTMPGAYNSHPSDEKRNLWKDEKAINAAV